MELRKIVASSSLLLSLLSAHTIYADFTFEPDRPVEPSRPRPGQPNHPTQPTDPWGDRPQDRYEDRYGQERIIERQIRRYVLQEPVLDLLQDFSLRRELDGKELLEVSIIASTEQGRGTAQLRINRLEMDYPQTVQRALTLYTFRADPLRNIIGRDILDLELGLRGKFYIEKVAFKVRERSQYPDRPTRPERPRVEVVRQIVNEAIEGEGGITLDRHLNLALHHGKIVKRLLVKARSLRGGYARVELQVNGQRRQEASLSGYSSEVALDFYSQERLGIDIRSIKAVIRGSAIIEEVALELESRGAGPGPGPIDPYPSERRIERVLNTRLFDGQTLELRNVLALNPRLEEREVESLEVVIRGSEFGARVKACQKMGVYGSITCSPVEVLDGNYTVLRLTLPYGTKAREAALQVRGTLDLESIALNLR